MAELDVKPRSACRWDCVSLGEVMLRFDPGDEPVHTARSFRVWEGGGEYNVARALRRCFGQRAAIVTALADNAAGRLVEDLILQGGVSIDHLRWVEYDGVGRAARNGIYFLERGFGARPARATYDRASTAISQLAPGEVDWRHIFDREGARWFHTGGIYAGLSEVAPEVAREAMQAARAAGAIVSYDANYRSLLWQDKGGREAARVVNRELARSADVVFGSADDFGVATDAAYAAGGDGSESYERLLAELSNLKAIATTRREVRSASVNVWGATIYTRAGRHDVAPREIDVLDRVGSGDAFAAGVICGLLEGRGARWAVECGAAAGALAMTTPGDSLHSRHADVEHLMRGSDARAVR